MWRRLELGDRVRGRRSWLSRSAIINAPRELLTASKAMQRYGLAVYWLQD